MTNEFTQISQTFKYQIISNDLKTNKISSVFCFADGYDVNQDGSISFYSLFSNPKTSKNIKLTTLTYPAGKWEACVLCDNNNNYYIFSDPNKHDNIASNPNLNTNSQQNLHQQPHLSAQQLSSMLNGNNNDYKKQKDEWIEKIIKDYIRNIDNFDLSHFQNYLASFPENKTLKPTEVDIQWLISKLIRDKILLSRKFNNPIIQKELNLILPDIMRRQWDGKMAPILQVLRDKEETKNVSPIDMAVWMSSNNFI